MKIELKNDYGRFEIGGGNHPIAQIKEIVGIGLPAKEQERIVFSEQAGYTVKGVRDLERTITMSFDFYGGVHEIERLYKILYHDTDIYISANSRQRKITGICINPSEPEKIIFHKQQAIALQFVCNNPYFTEFESICIPIAQRENLFPNLYENGEWYINLPAVATSRILKTTIVNQGDIYSYPIIHIHNNSNSEPGDFGIVITNETTGNAITINYDVDTNEEVTVDIPQRHIFSNVNGDITNKISDNTVLADFFLQVGENVISVINENAKSDTGVTLEYYNNYASAVI